MILDCPLKGAPVTPHPIRIILKKLLYPLVRGFAQATHGVCNLDCIARELLRIQGKVVLDRFKNRARFLAEPSYLSPLNTTGLEAPVALPTDAPSADGCADVDSADTGISDSRTLALSRVTSSSRSAS